MKAYGNSFSVIRNNYKYEIPFFQRRYVWDEDNWSELLESMSNKDVCPFLGSIIIKENHDTKGNLFWSVIDGQQRLTTLSILMRACFDKLNEYKDADCYKSKYDDEDLFGDQVRMPFNQTTHYRDSLDERHTKIIHCFLDRKDYESVMRGDFKDTYNVDMKDSSKIIRCYAYFRKSIENMGLSSIQVVWNYITKKIDERDEKGKYLVVIELGAYENEQAIFDTVNTAGVRLTCADTIKNSLFQKYIDLLRSSGLNESVAQEKATAYYKNKWENVFSKDQEIVTYWNSKRQVGRFFRDNIEILLHSIAVIDEFFDPSKKLSELPQLYKEHINNMSCSDLEKFIDKIAQYADLYQTNIQNLDEKTRYSFDVNDYLPRLMHICDVLEISTFLPYVLYLLYNEKTNSNDPKDKLLKLEKYLLLHAICGETTKNYNNECVQLIKNNTNIDELFSKCESINKIKYNYGIRNVYSNKLATLLLFWVELYKRSNSFADSKELNYVFTLEHIMPQKWKEYWSVQSLPVRDENGTVISDEETAEKTRQAAVYEIGNMTLINSKLNTSLRNFEFSRKVKGEGRKKGMGDLADCLITKEVIKNNEWDEQNIRSRTEELSKDIIKIWDLTSYVG